MVASFQGTPYDTGLDLELLYEIGESIAKMSANYRMLFTAEATRPSVAVLLHQVPGGMISNLVSQLREQKALDKLPAVHAEIPRVRADLGYPPLVTPTSQIVGVQAVLNVLSGKRYQQVTKEVKEYLAGYYGRPPGKVNEALRKQITGEAQPIAARPGELLPPELEKARAEATKLGIVKQEEDVVTYALYPQVATKFLRGELKEEALPSCAPAAERPATEIPTEFSVDVDGEVFSVKVSAVTGKATTVEKTRPARDVPKGAVVSPMAGMVLAIKVKAGETVKVGDPLVVIEAMKMGNDVRAPHAGTVKEVRAYEGEIINLGDVLMVVA